MRALVLVLTMLALTAPARAAEYEVRSGALTARVTDAPFSLRFEQPGGPVLEQAGGLGYRQAGAWTRADAAEVRREGDALVAAAGPLTVKVAPAGEGVVAVTFAHGSPAGVEALGAEFRTVGEERFLGLGQRATGVDHRGRVVESFVADGVLTASFRRPRGRASLRLAGCKRARQRR